MWLPSCSWDSMVWLNSVLGRFGALLRMLGLAKSRENLSGRLSPMLLVIDTTPRQAYCPKLAMSIACCVLLVDSTICRPIDFWNHFVVWEVILRTGLDMSFSGTSKGTPHGVKICAPAFKLSDQFIWIPCDDSTSCVRTLTNNSGKRYFFLRSPILEKRSSLVQVDLWWRCRAHCQVRQKGFDSFSDWCSFERCPRCLPGQGCYR